MIADLLFMAIVFPLSLYAGWSDLKTMTIPNWVSIAMIAGFVIVGLFILPFETILWRLGAAAIVLTIGFFLNGFGYLGGGDAKYLAAITPFISLENAASFMMIFSISLIGTLLLHRIAMRIPALRRATPDWASWKAGRNFPMGISIAAAIMTFLLLKSINGV